MTESKRTWQRSGVNYPRKLDGSFVTMTCFRCSRFEFPSCKDTGETIAYPVSGPVGERCPLSDYQDESEEPANQCP